MISLRIRSPLYSLLFFFALMPYISPWVQFPGNLQPYCFVLGWILALMYVNKKRWMLDFDGYFLGVVFFSIVTIFYLNPFGPVDIGQIFRKSISIFMSLGLLFIVSMTGFLKAKNAVVISVGLYTFFGLLHYLDADLFIELASKFVLLRDVEIGVRGTPSLAPEATDFGFTMVYMIVIVCIMRADRLLSAPLFSAIFLACIVNVVLSQSVSGVIAGCLLSGIWCVRRIQLSTKRLIFGFFLVVFFLASSEAFLFSGKTMFGDVRVVQIGSEFLRDPSILLSTSFAHRFVHLYVGALGFFQTVGLGFGAGTFTIIAPEIYINSNVSAYFGLNAHYTHACYESLKESPVSVIGLLIFEYGFVGFALVLYLISLPFLCKNKYRYYISALIFLTLFQSFPLAYPLMWLLLGYVFWSRETSAGLVTYAVRP